MCGTSVHLNPVKKIFFLKDDGSIFFNRINVFLSNNFVLENWKTKKKQIKNTHLEKKEKKNDSNRLIVFRTEHERNVIQKRREKRKVIWQPTAFTSFSLQKTKNNTQPYPFCVCVCVEPLAAAAGLQFGYWASTSGPETVSRHWAVVEWGSCVCEALSLIFGVRVVLFHSSSLTHFVLDILNFDQKKSNWLFSQFDVQNYSHEECGLCSNIFVFGRPCHSSMTGQFRIELFFFFDIFFLFTCVLVSVSCSSFSLVCPCD